MAQGIGPRYGDIVSGGRVGFVHSGGGNWIVEESRRCVFYGRPGEHQGGIEASLALPFNESRIQTEYTGQSTILAAMCFRNNSVPVSGPRRRLL
jgi:hypothetical protein